MQVRSHFYTSVSAIHKFDYVKHDVLRPIVLKISSTNIAVTLRLFAVFKMFKQHQRERDRKRGLFSMLNGMKYAEKATI